MDTSLSKLREPRSRRSVRLLSTRRSDAAPESLRVEAFVANARGDGAAELLGTVREKPGLLIPDPKKEIRAFRVAMSSQLGATRDRGRGGFIDSVLDLLDTFDGDVVQYLKAWSAAPPRMRETEVVPTQEPASVASTAISSQDGT